MFPKLNCYYLVIFNYFMHHKFQYYFLMPFCYNSVFMKLFVVTIFYFRNVQMFLIKNWFWWDLLVLILWTFLFYWFQNSAWSITHISIFHCHYSLFNNSNSLQSYYYSSTFPYVAHWKHYIYCRKHVMFTCHVDSNTYSLQ